MRALIDFLTGYHPPYADVVRGFPEVRIAELERALGQALPATYREFLSTVGANLGFFVDEVVFDIDELIELIEEKSATRPRHLVPIAIDESPSYMDYFLDLSDGEDGEDGVVVRSAAGSLSFDDISYVYPSLRDLLFVTGFRAVRMLTLPHRAGVSWPLEDFSDPASAPRRDLLHAQFEAMGFRELGVTGERCGLYERGDCAAIVVTQPPGVFFSLFLAAEDPKTAVLVSELLCDAMPGNGRRIQF